MAGASINGLGLAISTGTGVLDACAAHRAGLSRPSLLEAVEIWNPEAEENEPLVAHRVGGVPIGAEAQGKWVPLARAALRDLSTTAAGASAELVVCAPELDPERYLLEPADVTRLAQLVASGGAWSAARHMNASLDTVTEAMNAALTAAHATVIVLVDSLVDAPSVARAQRTRRLKTPENPVGFIPGEAGAAIRLDPAGAGSAAIRAVAADRDEPLGDGAELFSGAGAARAVARALGAAGVAHDAPIHAVVNLNGETVRAHQWGSALARLHADYDVGAWFTDITALTFGETGIAALGIGIAVAVRALERGYAAGDVALVCTLGDAGEVSAVVITRQVS